MRKARFTKKVPVGIPTEKKKALPEGQGHPSGGKGKRGVRINNYGESLLDGGVQIKKGKGFVWD